MIVLCGDVIRYIASYLSIGDIFHLCRVNHTFSAAIYLYPAFWCELARIHLTDRLELPTLSELRKDLYGYYLFTNNIATGFIAKRIAKRFGFMYYTKFNADATSTSTIPAGSAGCFGDFVEGLALGGHGEIDKITSIHNRARGRFNYSDRARLGRLEKDILQYTYSKSHMEQYLHELYKDDCRRSIQTDLISAVLYDNIAILKAIIPILSLEERQSLISYILNRPANRKRYIMLFLEDLSYEKKRILLQNAGVLSDTMSYYLTSDS